MSSAYQLVIFDWEGTIADTLGVILHTVATEAKTLGFGDIDPYQARKYVDLGLVQAVKKTLPNLTAGQQEDLLQAVQSAMISRPTEVRLIPGVLEFIKQLHQAKVDLAIATNKGHNSLIRALQATELDQLFKVTRSAGQVPAKPCPQMLEEIMEEFGRDPSSTLMIGDSTTDMEMAKRINVNAIGMDFYHQQEDALKAAGALAVFDDYKLLSAYLMLPEA
ncbi:HAD-IA family hydrolase [Legionella sp. PATHC032]|uniref:HAD family hydrolase n=1 Tax=Legionella sp. PATHC032 TaxID=2992039 RepID=UPI001AFCDAF0|nr:HAD-IA family hydrolase [Legionella sp. PATHC032]MCW8422244.1 HAD-IA family hydrolase [Legionella sp. PATHC032]HAZ7572715.1 HAD-IA family hydrolase [Legionella pneumophila]HBA1634910.1 HAD-IA family hydrolase [Legionella pneumophila]